MTDASRVEKLVRGIGRRTDFLVDKAKFIESGEHYQDVLSQKNKKKLILRFLRNPTQFLPSEQD